MAITKIEDLSGYEDSDDFYDAVEVEELVNRLQSKLSVWHSTIDKLPELNVDLIIIDGYMHFREAKYRIYGGKKIFFDYEGHEYSKNEVKLWCYKKDLLRILYEDK